jgi:hypothetical protein
MYKSPRQSFCFTQMLQMRRICCMIVAFRNQPQGSMVSTRWKLWLGASALAIASGALPAAQILSPIADGLLGHDLIEDAQAQESGETEGEGSEADCAPEGAEGEEGGAVDCPAPAGEDGEGEGG